MNKNSSILWKIVFCSASLNVTFPSHENNDGAEIKKISCGQILYIYSQLQLGGSGGETKERWGTQAL